MSIWDKLRAKILDIGVEPRDREEAASPPAPPASERGATPSPATISGRPAASPFIRLERFGAPGGAREDEVLEALAKARQTQDETPVLQAVLVARDRLTEPLRAACADLLVARGEEERAVELLAPCRSPGPLMMAADLYAARGEIARALGTIERVLARDLGSPGALERHRRWSEALGATQRPARRLDEPTMIASATVDAPFRIDREVARGGAGAVYEAYDEVLQRKVAFKAYHGGEGDRAAALNEVRLAAKLAGPFVIRVLDASPEGGWVALEWVAGGSLRDHLRSGRVDPLWPLARWTIPLARALARVHSAGYVHADVKPTNVLFRAANEPLLTDFGIARAVGAKAAGGSAGYVSPERMAGAPAAFADDVYGFGRTVEDVLAAGGDRPAGGFGDVVAACLDRADRRPPDGAALVSLLAAVGQS